MQNSLSDNHTAAMRLRNDTEVDRCLRPPPLHTSGRCCVEVPARGLVTFQAKVLYFTVSHLGALREQNVNKRSNVARSRKPFTPLIVDRISGAALRRQVDKVKAKNKNKNSDTTAVVSSLPA